MSSVYWDYLMSGAGWQLRRYDANVDNLVNVYYEANGKIRVGEYDGYDDVYEPQGILREITYIGTTGDYSLGWTTPQYDIGHSAVLDDGDNTETYGDANDWIEARLGVDIINGGNGENYLFGQAGDDTLYGGNRTDIELGSSGDDTLYGGAKNDWLFGGLGNDAVYGDGGNDTISGDTGDDDLNGGSGNDIILDLFGNNLIHGNDGEDFVIAGSGNDYINLGADDDWGVGGDGVDRIFGGDGRDFILGQGGADRLSGDAGNDVIDAADGNNIARGGSGDDAVYGGQGSDHLYGDDGSDLLYADEDPGIAAGMDDFVYGGQGDDTLYAGGGRDKLFGGDDLDFLSAGPYGQAYLTGGGGKDVFEFTGFSPGPAHRIEDFTRTDSDEIHIGVLQGYNAGTSAVDDFVRLVTRDAARTDLKVNADGAGGGWTILATLLNVDLTGVTATDLVNGGNLFL